MSQSQPQAEHQPQCQFNFNGASVLVTGGTSGIGYAIARGFIDAGADVTVTGTRASEADYEVDLTGATYRQLDVRSRDEIEALASSLSSLDILINNAGASLPGGQDEWLPEVFEESVKINLFSAFHLAQACLPLLQKSHLPGGAAVLGIASMTSFFANSMVPGYGAAKAGLVQLTKTLAQTWAPHNIRANAIAAGLIKTRMTEIAIGIDELSKPMLDRTPMGRVGSPEEIANAALFLCSGQASYITGETLCVDGGFSISG